MYEKAEPRGMIKGPGLFNLASIVIKEDLIEFIVVIISRVGGIAHRQWGQVRLLKMSKFGLQFTKQP